LEAVAKILNPEALMDWECRRIVLKPGQSCPPAKANHKIPETPKVKPKKWDKLSERRPASKREECLLSEYDH